MADYSAPLEDMRFVLYELFRVHERWSQLPGLTDMAERDTADAILEEAAKVCAGLIAPLNRSGDEEGCHWSDGKVTTPAGFKEAYQAYVEGGWTALAGNPEFGGMGMPKSLSVLCEEMLYSANNAFALYPALTVGACIALDAHGSEALKQRYLPKLYEGTWSGVMALTEPQAGTDLGIIRTKADDLNDGTFAISGSKIFITAGEHDLCENIVHFVLAKLPDAPVGPKGISLFLVPKYWLDDGGTMAPDGNGVSCGSIEHKMGIRASATCVINYDKARGYLIGEPHQGLKCMFTMMNFERLSIGIQGIGSAEMSYQSARAYALERLQSRAATGATEPAKVADPIVVHADVRRMLLTMRSWTEGARALAVYTAEQLDVAKYSSDEGVVAQANNRVALLTPLCKAFFTDKGFDCCVLGQQVFGGHGYICEYGQEQLVRDTRIAQIYEGTNGIQALDLAGRKVIASKGVLVQEFVAEMRQWLVSQAAPELAFYVESLEAELARLEKVTEDLVERSHSDANAAGAASVEYLHLLGYVTYAWFWTQIVSVSVGKTDKFYLGKVAVANFYFRHLLPQTKALADSIVRGSEAVMAPDAELF